MSSEYLIHYLASINHTESTEDLMVVPFVWTRPPSVALEVVAEALVVDVAVVAVVTVAVAVVEVVATEEVDIVLFSSLRSCSTLLTYLGGGGGYDQGRSGGGGGGEYPSLIHLKYR